MTQQPTIAGEGDVVSFDLPCKALTPKQVRVFTSGSEVGRLRRRYPNAVVEVCAAPYSKGQEAIQLEFTTPKQRDEALKFLRKTYGTSNVLT